MEGKVYLVGAGPGDYKLITVKGMELIKKADVVVYDRLINNNYLKEVRDDAELIYVGKKPDNHTYTQEEINQILVDKAKEGRMVVRLKGGDPYVFGRGGEEGNELYDNNIDFEVVPGITSVIGGLCYGGIPITHRDYASSFHVMTGHTKYDEELDYSSLSKLNGTLVFVMGMKNLENIVNNLVKHGKDKRTPVAIINYATRTNQRSLVGTLEDICEEVNRNNIGSPSLIVIGDVVKLRDKLSFFENKPLFNKNIVVTRSRSQNSSLVEKLEDLGASVIEFPTIKLKETENSKFISEIKNIERYSYIIFTSINSVNIFFDNLYKLNYDARKLYNAKIVAIGKATNELLNRYGIKADIIPDKYDSRSIVDKLKSVLEKDDNILLPRGSKAKNYIHKELKDICNIKEIILYDTLLEKNTIDIKSKLSEIDYITFTSSSTVENFIKIIGEDNKDLLSDIKLISIGPLTSKTIYDNNFKVYSEAKESSIDAIIKCILEDTMEENS